MCVGVASNPSYRAERGRKAAVAGAICDMSSSTFYLLRLLSSCLKQQSEDTARNTSCPSVRASCQVCVLLSVIEKPSAISRRSRYQPIWDRSRSWNESSTVAPTESTLISRESDFAARTQRDMASMLTIAMAAASSSASIDIPRGRDAGATFTGVQKQGLGLLTPPSSISPHMPAHAANHLKSPPLLNIVEEDDGEMAASAAQPATPPQEAVLGTGAPLSIGALSGLDARAAITPALLAKDYLPAIMLGNGPQPIRHVIGELTHTVPGFSRIPPAKARRIVVAALESRPGGGPDGEIMFYKTGWGRWAAQIKSAGDQMPIGDESFAPGMSVPANFGRATAMHETLQSTSYGGQAGAWTQYDDRDEDLDMDMDMPDENEADKMSLDDEVFSSESDDDESDATDDDDWAAVGAQALRKASLPAPGQPAPPRTNYQALGVPISRPALNSWSRRFSAVSERSVHSAAIASSCSPHFGPLHPGLQTPEERVAIEALLNMGSI